VRERRPREHAADRVRRHGTRVARLAEGLANETGKVYHVPAERDLDSTSYHGGFRRYFGGDGTSYTGLTYSHGISREIRSLEDLTTLNGDTVRGEFDVLSGQRFRIFGALGTRPSGNHLGWAHPSAWLPPATAGSAEPRAPSREPRRHPAVGSSSARR